MLVHLNFKMHQQKTCTRNSKQNTRVVYRIGIFWSILVSISWYLPYQYRRKTRSVHSGIKKGQLPPFSSKRGAMAPPFEEKRGEQYKKGRNDTNQKYQYRANLIPGKYRYRKNDWNHDRIAVPRVLSMILLF